MSEREFENYLALMSGLLRLSRSQREAIAHELQDHLDERLSELLDRGISREDAVPLALEEFGDASNLAAELTRSGRKKQRRWMMRLTMTSLATSVALLMVALALWPDRRGGPALDYAMAQDAVDAAALEPSAIEVPAADVVRVKIAVSEDERLNRETEAKLRRRIAADFFETPLGDILAFISDTLGVQTYIDREALKQEGHTDETIQVSINLSSVPADMLLDLVLGPRGLDYTVRSGILIVSSAQELEADVEVRVYNVSDFLSSNHDVNPVIERAALRELTEKMRRSPGAPYAASEGEAEEGNEWADFEQAVRKRLLQSEEQVAAYQRRAADLLQLITRCVEPETWSQVGGEGEMQFYRGALVVSQSSKVHRKLVRVLADLRATTASNLDIPLEDSESMFGRRR